MARPIRLVRVRQNNLKNISVEFPSRKITVVTGLSGSGKSSLAFDTLYAEGQRRYVESLSTYTRQFLEKMPKPDLDSIENIPPAIALEQKNHVVNSRSTVGTQTEIVDYLRVLFAKIGKTRCINCGGEVKQMNSQSILDWAAQWLPERKAVIVGPLSTAAPEPEAKPKRSKSKTKKPAASKTKALTAASHASLFQLIREQGFQRVLLKSAQGEYEVLNIEDVAGVDTSKSEIFVVVDRLKISGEPDVDTRGRLLDSIDQALSIGRGNIGFLDLDEPNEKGWKSFNNKFACVDCGREHRIPEAHLFSFNSPLGACPKCSGFGYTLDLDESLVVPDPTKTLKNGAIDPFSKTFAF